MESKPGVGIGVRDLLDEAEPVRWLAEPMVSERLIGRKGAVFGGRLIPGDPWRLSPTVYANQERQVLILIDEFRKALGSDPDPAEERQRRSQFVIFGCLFALANTPQSFYQAAFSKIVN